MVFSLDVTDSFFWGGGVWGSELNALELGPRSRVWSSGSDAYSQGFVSGLGLGRGLGLKFNNFPCNQWTGVPYKGLGTILNYQTDPCPPLMVS